MNTTTLTFVQVNTDTLRVLEGVTSALAHRLYCRIVRLRDYATNTCKVSQGKLADAMGVTTEGVRKALSILRDAGLIDWQSKHRRASTYSVKGLVGAQSVGPTQVGSNCPTGVGSISNRFSSLETPLPPGESERVCESPMEGWDSSFEETEEAGRLDHVEANARAVELVPQDASLKDLDRIVRETMAGRPGQRVPDFSVRASYEGPAHMPIRPECVDDAVVALIGSYGSAKSLPRVFASLRRSVVAMGVSGELTPHLLDCALIRASGLSTGSLNLSRVGVEIWRGVLVNRWEGTRVSDGMFMRYGDHRPTPTGVGTTPQWRAWLVPEAAKVSA